MAIGKSTAQNIEQSSRRYRIGDGVVVTQDDNRHDPARGAYAKNGKTGALFRLGRGESLLLTGLGAGFSVDAMVGAFAHRMQISITSEAIEKFAQDMAACGLLEPLDQDQPEPGVVAIGGAVPAAHFAEHEYDLSLFDDDPDPDKEGEDFFSEDNVSEVIFDDELDDELDYALDNEPDDAPEDLAEDAPQDNPRDAEFFDARLFRTGFGRAQKNADGTRPAAAPGGIADPKIAQRSLRYGKSGPAPVRILAIRLFDPSRLLRLLNILFGWIATGLSWLTMPLAVVALLSIFHRLDEVLATLGAGFANLGLLGHLALSMVTVNLLTRLVVGVIIQREGAEVPGFGINFMFLLIPRFAVDTTNMFRLDRKSRMRVFAGALKTRLLLFALCTLFWDGSRLGGTGFSEFVAILSQISLLGFLISAFPLINGEGYRLMMAYFDQPFLRERALALLVGQGKNNKLPPIEGRQWWIFLLYGLSIIIFSAFVVTLVAAYVSTALVGRFGGTGAIIFVSLIGLMILWFFLTKSQNNRLYAQIVKQVLAERVAQHHSQETPRNTGPDSGMSGLGAHRPRLRYGRFGGAGAGAGETATAPSRHLAVPAPQHPLVLRNTSLTQPAATSLDAARPLPGLYAKNARTSRGTWLRRGLLLATLGGAVFVAFLPYQYDAGGDFTILPDARVEVIARVPGELAEVMVEEGDAVEAGEVLARQQGIQERHSLAVATAALAKAEAQFQTLQSGATLEELRVAQEQVSRVEVELPYLEAEAKRAEELLQRGAIPEAQADAINNSFEKAKADLRMAVANLEEVQAVAQESEIAASKADIDRLAAEKEYYEQLLKDTEIVAPVSGRVVIEGKKPVRGTYLQVGDTLMEIEDHRIAQAEIQLPETDIGLIRIGQQVRLKSWARPDEEWIGTVASIAPVAEPQEFGKIVRVRTRLSNEGGVFRPGMTGFAKVEGPQMRVWEAYSRLFVRFVLVEIWGWIP